MTWNHNKEILIHALAREEAQVPVPNQPLDAGALADDRLSDRECFRQIEAVVGVLEALGSGCGGRHDF